MDADSSSQSYLLAIETSCDETSASIIDSQLNLLATVTASQVQLHKQTGGIVPEIASRQQARDIIPVIQTTLQQARLTLKDIRRLAVTTGPGLNGSLLIGTETIRTLGWQLKLPIVPVNHIYAHLVSPLINPQLKAEKIQFPLLALTVSGGHTQLVLLTSWQRYRILGETEDDAAGEALDKIARLIGFSYPGGPVLEKLARRFRGLNPLHFPSPKIQSADLNFSFSGLKTAVRYHLQNHPLSTRPMQKKLQQIQIAHAAQQAVIQVLASKTAHAAQIYQPKTIFVTGGVANNRALRQACRKKIPSLPIYFPPSGKSTDNAAMVAIAARLNGQPVSWKKISAQPNLPL